MKKSLIILIVLAILAVVGEVKCIVKAFSCNWEPIGKAEAVYTISALMGIGAIVGYIDIEDK